MISKFDRANHDVSVPEWILPPSSCEFLKSIAAILPDGSSAFEFGSGRSTHVLRQAFNGLTSVESSAKWLERTEEMSDSEGKCESDSSPVIPLERCWNRFRPIESFNLDSRADVLERLKRSRLVLIDSPPNPAKREHALFLALRVALVGAVIVLDDLEVGAALRFACRLAKQNTNSFRFWILDIDHKLGIFLKVRSGRIRSWPSLTGFIGTWLRA